MLGEEIMNKNIQIKNSSVLVTGGAGFIGSSLVRKLEERKCAVTVLDNLIAGRREHLQGTKAELVVGDIRNAELIRYLISKNSIEYVFHLAAEPYIPKGYVDPEVMFHVNTLGSINVFLQAHKAGVKKILHYSTSEVYGSARTLPMNEEHVTTPHSIYAVAKLAADRAAYILWREKKIPVIILRQFNCFTADTQIATPDGLRYINKLKKGDKVFTLNPDTNEIEIDEVEQTIKSRTQELVSLLHKSLDFLVSPEHRFFLRSHGRKKFNWYLAKDLLHKKNDYRFPIHNENSKGHEDFDEKTLKLMAWYISEGYSVFPYELRICQRTPKYRREIKELISELGFHPIETFHYIALSSKETTAYISELCGEGSHNKKIPQIVYSLSPRMRKLFFDTLMKGDGTKSRSRYSTVSKQLAEDVLCLGLYNGLRGRIRKEKGIKGIVFRVDFRILPTCIKPVHIKKIKRRTKVYCITARRHHIIYAGRNGKLNWIGQCFGPREAQPYIIPEIISQFAHKGTTLTLGNIYAKRDFTFVDDASEGAIKLMEVPGLEGQIVNLGRGKNWSVKEIVEAIADVMNINNWRIDIDQSRLRPYDVDELLCDTSYFNKLTGGIEYTDFREGLRKTIEWYNNNDKKWSWEKPKEE